ncbi:hypothetical protein ASR50_00260 [Streptomyces sp. 4F]|nr:hypothetical protein ASR50_00260 [Streptomyces sp. 4F]
MKLEELHPAQRAAVLHLGDVVLRAGPGSGTTRTLVARAAYLLETQISASRGIACITYTNAAADEIRRRPFPSAAGGGPLPAAGTGLGRRRLHRHHLTDWSATQLGVVLDIVRRSEDVRGFQPLPRR